MILQVAKLIANIRLTNLAMSCLILSGIFLMQSAHFRENSTENLAAVLIPIVIAAFSYPLGNRMTMDGCPKHLTSMQRIFGMTPVQYAILGGVCRLGRDAVRRSGFYPAWRDSPAWRCNAFRGGICRNCTDFDRNDGEQPGSRRQVIISKVSKIFRQMIISIEVLSQKGYNERSKED